jgi:hypothetical protein
MRASARAGILSALQRRDDMDAALIPPYALVRIQTEYLEMPGLKLTLEQVGRLCGLTQELSEAALAGLTRSGFLRRTQDGAFLRQS